VTAHRRRIGLALLAIGSACVVALHVVHAVRGDLAPWRHRISEYANGAGGALMAVAFVAVGLALLALGPALGRRRRVAGPAVRLAGVGLVASAAFRTGASEAGEVSDAVHSVTSSAATLAMVVAVVASRRPGPTTLAVVLAAAGPLTDGTVLGGVVQRALWVTLLVWLVRQARPDRPDLSATSAGSRTIVA
jgi:hypothetical protein